MGRCLVMGIVNVTPDSFSDGGKYFQPEEAVRRAVNLASDGADIIDLGGESTRPGAVALGWQEEWARIGPVLSLLRSAAAQKRRVSVSVDTYHPETAERAIAAGADMINCVKSETAADMARLCSSAGAMLAIPAAAFDTPSVAASLPPADRTFIDPMIGFGTTREEDLSLIRSVPALALRARVLVGASRKRIVKKLTGEKMTGKNLGGNLGIAIWCALHGASAVRVHDVKETVQAIKVVDTLCEYSS